MPAGRLIGVVVALTCVPTGSAQSRLSFDIASVKVSAGSLLMTAPQRAGGRIRWTTDLHHLISYAYRIPMQRISGEFPKKAPIYTIEATTDPATTDDQVRLMFQSLLADRFKLALHRESKETVGYALSVAKKGLKIHEAKAEDDVRGSVAATLESKTVGKIVSKKGTMSQLCAAVAIFLHTFVLDETGLQGVYDFEIAFAHENAADSEAGPLFRVIQDELGLTLEKRKGAIESLVVDHLESVPIEN